VGTFHVYVAVGGFQTMYGSPRSHAKDRAGNAGCVPTKYEQISLLLPDSNIVAWVTPVFLKVPYLRSL